MNDDLIKKLLNIIYEYLDNMKNSEFFTKLENNGFLLSIGFRMMIHIFQLNYIHSKNIDDVYLNCQKAYYYYSEYLEQMYSTNMCQDLNHLDALLFVYSKTLIKYENICHTTQIPNLENDVFIKKMSKITKLLNTLFWWENSFDTKTDSVTHISEVNLGKTSSRLLRSGAEAEAMIFTPTIKSFPDKSLFFEILQKHYRNETDELQISLEEKQKTKVSYDEYILFLHQLPNS